MVVSFVQLLLSKDYIVSLIFNKDYIVSLVSISCLLVICLLCMTNLFRVPDWFDYVSYGVHALHHQVQPFV